MSRIKKENNFEEITKEENNESEEEIYTPSEYFDYVKDMKKKATSENSKKLADACLQMIEKFKLTGQANAAKIAEETYEVLNREISLIENGIDTYVMLDDVTRYIKQVSGKSVKIIEVEHFPRVIPDDVINKIVNVRDLFDKMYIVFTDYTEDESSTTVAASDGKRSVVKEVEKRRKDKDPILFGAIRVNRENTSMKKNTYEKLFFIADWVDDYCDLTFDKIIADMAEKGINGPSTISPVTTVEEFRERSKQ